MLKENNITPKIMHQDAHFSVPVSNLKKNPMISNNKAWYIWYLTPVSKLVNLSKERTFLKACAPNAPKITEVIP